MGERATVTSWCGFEADGVGFLNPFLHADLVAVETRLTFNCGEFAIIKTGIENRLPDAQKLDRVAVSQPIRDKELAVLRLEHIRERDIVAILAGENGHSRSVDFNDGFLGLAHGLSWLVSNSLEFVGVELRSGLAAPAPKTFGVAPLLVGDIQLLAVEGFHSICARELNKKLLCVARIDAGTLLCRRPAAAMLETKMRSEFRVSPTLQYCCDWLSAQSRSATFSTPHVRSIKTPFNATELSCAPVSMCASRAIEKNPVHGPCAANSGACKSNRGESGRGCGKLVSSRATG
jgi:hypothetical protein